MGEESIICKVLRFLLSRLRLIHARKLSSLVLGDALGCCVAIQLGSEPLRPTALRHAQATNKASAREMNASLTRFMIVLLAHGIRSPALLRINDECVDLIFC
jgi:hypothetical protein